MLAIVALIVWTSCQSGRDKDFTIEWQRYGNDKGIGFFYPATQDVTLSGIAKIYGLAYTGEGLLEEDKGVGRVTLKKRCDGNRSRLAMSNKNLNGGSR